MSSVRSLIEESLRIDAGSIQVRPKYTLQYGIDYGHAGLNTKLNSRAVLVCGGCIQGTIQVKGTKERKPHADCHGSGWRLNRRYGRAGNGRFKG